MGRPIKLTTFERMTVGSYKGRQIVVQTARSAGHPLAKRGGYVLRLDPPVFWMEYGEDIEGVGWWPWPEPIKRIQRWYGWYKRRACALQRAAELTKCGRLSEDG